MSAAAGKRLKVLMSSYACNPNEGSEPMVGWRWAMEMAHCHDITVLTRSNNREEIEAFVADLPEGVPRPEFVYFDLGPILRRLKKFWGMNQWYYLIWQRRARRAIAERVAQRDFDLLHHVTYATYRYATAVDKHGVPVVWGPVGGGEYIPWSFLTLGSPRSFLRESTRNVINALQQVPFLRLMSKSIHSEQVLASTRETQKKFSRYGVTAPVLPTIGMDVADFDSQPRERGDGPLKIVFVGNLLLFKGVHLGLEALAEADFPFELTIVGDGIYRRVLERIVKRHSMGDRVHFAGKVPLEQVRKFLREAEVFQFTSLADSGGIALLEAMALGLPAVCLDRAGPGVALTSSCGTAVPVTTRAETRTAICEGFRRYHDDPELYRAHSEAAIERVRSEYDWVSKRKQMDGYYRAASGVEGTSS